MVSTATSGAAVNSDVMHALEDLVRGILTDNPDHPVRYMISRLCEQTGTPTPEQLEKRISELQSENSKLQGYVRLLLPATTPDSDTCDEYDPPSILRPVTRRPLERAISTLRSRRQSVSAEVYGKHNQPTIFLPPTYEHTVEEDISIRSLLGEVFLFSTLDRDDFDTVVNAVQRVNVTKDTEIIKQGDDGDAFFVVELGTFKFSKRDEGDVGECGVGDWFGELALLHNAPRAATVTALEDSSVWSVDRQTFSHIVREAAVRKRQVYEEFLATVPLLQLMDAYQKGLIADCLKPQFFNKGQTIIRENDIGDCFYFLEKGRAEATKWDGGNPKVVMTYEAGGYFGELALLQSAPRAATITATTANTKVAYLDRKSFMRLLAPMDELITHPYD